MNNSAKELFQNIFSLCIPSITVSLYYFVIFINYTKYLARPKPSLFEQCTLQRKISFFQNVVHKIRWDALVYDTLVYIDTFVMLEYIRIRWIELLHWDALVPWGPNRYQICILLIFNLL